MFFSKSDASKIALVCLIEFTQELGHTWTNCQLYSHHLASMGAKEIPREEFQKILHKAKEASTIVGPWFDISSCRSMSIEEVIAYAKSARVD